MIRQDSINELIASREALGVIGLGYVGLPLVLRFFEVGFRTLNFDTDYSKTSQIKYGKSYIWHIAGSQIQTAAKADVDF